MIDELSRYGGGAREHRRNGMDSKSDEMRRLVGSSDQLPTWHCHEICETALLTFMLLIVRGYLLVVFRSFLCGTGTGIGGVLGAGSPVWHPRYPEETDEQDKTKAENGASTPLAMPRT